MNERDDWLSPAAFVAGIDLGGEIGGEPKTEVVVQRHTPENAQYTPDPYSSISMREITVYEPAKDPLVSTDLVGKLYRGELRPVLLEEYDELLQNLFARQSPLDYPAAPRQSQETKND
jgi:hypothetical protein